MGAGAAKHGYKSGILPAVRPILKNPTFKQKTIIEKVQAPKPKGPHGVGYAPNIAHPKGSHRASPPMKFIDVETLIAKTVPSPLMPAAAQTPAQEAKQHRATLRRKFLSDAFRKEEERLLKEEEVLEKRQKDLERQRQAELAAMDESKTSDLTVPTIDKLLDAPLMRRRTPEERELLRSKRKHNRDLMHLNAEERKLEKLLQLYHVTDHFIVTEEQLIKNIDEAFANESSEALKTKLSVGALRPSGRNEKALGDALFGSIGGGGHMGLPVVKDFLSGESKAYAEEIDTKNKELLEKRRLDFETIL
ncbi:LAMI_0D10990g1_1 [Lachancea mirantina]|uniref:LAMI_0D10990g1_1 n=1 Tax=Lachancea mirantina TaxID=1230905 RepID=A0A1G4JEN6_9SACH|nr:LAMI_0D10990g1_1 [Lachancea mirantina]